MKKIYSILFCIVLLGSCNNFDDDININPNRPSEASAPQLLANAMLSLPSLSSTPTGEFMAQYLAETQYVNASLYPQTSTSFYWLYQGPLMNIETVLNTSTVNNHLVVAKVLKAYFFWHVTDRWGDVPYTESLKGDLTFTPAYDTQESIYNALFTLLKEANDTPVVGTMTNDIIYNGDLAKWKKLGNTIRMLMALRLSKIDPAKGESEFNDALSDGVLESNADNLVFKHLADANNQNYWFGQIVIQNREWWALTEGLVDKMKPFDDPRLPVYGNPNRTDDEYVGQLFGDTEDFDTEKYSLLGDAIWAQDAPVYLVTYAQVLFAKAEAAKLTWIAGGDAEAEANYNLAIEHSIRQWTGSATGVADFLLEPGIAYEAATAIEQIATQRWIHLFMHGYEGWAEWRRTGFPDDLVEPDNAAVPRRQIYVETEQFNNTISYDEAVQRQFGGAETLYGRIWWDVE